jgi:hypothetical protein
MFEIFGRNFVFRVPRNIFHSYALMFYPHVLVAWVTGWSLRCTLSVFRCREGGRQKHPLFPNVIFLLCRLHNLLLPSLLVEFCDGIDAGPEENHGVLENSTQILFLSCSCFFFWYWCLNSGPHA